MEATRQAELSFLTWLREDYLLRETEGTVWKNRDDITLTNHSGKYYSSGYYNWIYYVPSDVTGVTYPPVISDNDGAIDSSNYSINFLRGEVTFSGYTPVGTVSADFASHVYSIRLSGEPLYDMERARLSSINLDDVSTDSNPLQLGGGEYLSIKMILQIRSYSRREYFSEARASEVSDIIAKGIAQTPIPIIDFSTYFPLSSSGNRVTDYNRTTQEDGHYELDNNMNRVSNSKIVVAGDMRGLSRRQIDFTLKVTR